MAIHSTPDYKCGDEEVKIESVEDSISNNPYNFYG